MAVVVKEGGQQKKEAGSAGAAAKEKPKDDDRKGPSASTPPKDAAQEQDSPNPTTRPNEPAPSSEDQSGRRGGGEVYVSVMVLLLTAMRQGPTPRSGRELRAIFGVDRRTLGRWRTWWQAIFPATAFWQVAKARFMPPVAVIFPFLLVFKALRWVDTYQALIIVYLTFNMPYSVWMMRGFFQ